ncbi:hypothetical protein STAS_26821 [Striga asiatica]|uniref:Uncharacterized protein n=1 Tax=Striga asiatica TaxID=4170 RepID=A0A5A7QZZ3_STRAF|nr:hypothetical protein STAS_26821 [Striga asiatica]
MIHGFGDGRGGVERKSRTRSPLPPPPPRQLRRQLRRNCCCCWAVGTACWADAVGLVSVGPLSRRGGMAAAARGGGAGSGGGGGGGVAEPMSLESPWREERDNLRRSRVGRSQGRRGLCGRVIRIDSVDTENRITNIWWKGALRFMDIPVAAISGHKIPYPIDSLVNAFIKWHSLANMIRNPVLVPYSCLLAVIGKSLNALDELNPLPDVLLSGFLGLSICSKEFFNNSP